MREIIVTTESGNDLPPHLIEKYNIYVVNMHISMDGETYADRSIPVEKIFDYYERTQKIPSTSAANVYDFQTTFEKIHQEHPGCVIFHLAYSAATTASYQNAKIAAEDMEDIYFVDTQNVSGGSTAYIAKAMELIQKRQALLPDTKDAYEKLAAELSAMAAFVHFSFLPGNLDFLKAGGRVSNAAYLGARLLRIKPLIELIEGKLVATKKYFGPTDHLVHRFLDEFVKKNNISKEALYLVNTAGLSNAIKDKLIATAKSMGFQHVELNPCGLAITCHSGPASIGVGGWEVSLEQI